MWAAENMSMTYWKEREWAEHEVDFAWIAVGLIGGISIGAFIGTMLIAVLQAKQ
jgi:hypothetical protein